MTPHKLLRKYVLRATVRSLGFLIPNLVMASLLLGNAVLNWIGSMWFFFVLFGVAFSIVGLLESHTMMKYRETLYSNGRLTVSIDRKFLIQVVTTVISMWILGFVVYLSSNFHLKYLLLTVAASLWIGVGEFFRYGIVALYIVSKK